MSKPFAVRKVEPVGERTSPCFVDYTDGSGEFKEMTFNVYPESPCGNALKEARQSAGIFLGAAGKLLGVGAADISGLERGSLEFVDAGDWDHAIAAMRRNKKS